MATRAKTKPVSIDRKLVKELQAVLKGKPGIQVLGHLAVPAYCCGNGTVAIVKIDKGRPVEKK
ncbi:MAG: hypothetical protein ABW318_06190 [Vicinamibacterales bacterium]